MPSPRAVSQQDFISSRRLSAKKPPRREACSPIFRSAEVRPKAPFVPKRWATPISLGVAKLPNTRPRERSGRCLERDVEGRPMRCGHLVRRAAGRHCGPDRGIWLGGGPSHEIVVGMPPRSGPRFPARPTTRRQPWHDGSKGKLPGRCRNRIASLPVTVGGVREWVRVVQSSDN